MYRHYCFTYFGESEPVYDEKVTRYLCFQREKCPKTGKLHWQGFGVNRKAARIKGTQQNIGCPGAHIEKRKGAVEEAVAYCKKPESAVPDTFKEFGSLEGIQGKRTDLQRACLHLMSGGEMKEIEPTTFVKFHKGFYALKNLHMSNALREVRVDWYWGPPGCGKSKLAYEECPDAFWKAPGNNWWDGYDGQKTVIMDDYDDKWFTRAELLRITDRYPLRLPVKGSFTNAEFTRVIITSNFSPRQLYGEDMAVLRRCTSVLDEIEIERKPVSDFLDSWMESEAE